MKRGTVLEGPILQTLTEILKSCLPQARLTTAFLLVLSMFASFSCFRRQIEDPGQNDTSQFDTPLRSHHEDVSPVETLDVQSIESLDLATDAETTLDATCVPSCHGKTCGSNGCGSNCGKCATDFFCSKGRCVAECPDPGVNPVLLQIGPGGTLNSIPLDATDPVVKVAPGQPIVGVIPIDLIYSEHGSSQAVPLVVTPTWGMHSTSYVPIFVGLPSPPLISHFEWSADLVAPLLKGEYLIVFAAAEQMDTASVASGTMAVDDAPIWGDGNDIADLTEEELSGAPSKGYATLLLKGEHGSDCSAFGIAYVRVEVCQIDCDGQECGEDGCGGDCGICPGNQESCLKGRCVCQPDCYGVNCGEDGCGGVCGTCEPEQVCSLGTCLCAPNASKKCYGGDVVWVDSCGQQAALATDCGNADCAEGKCQEAGCGDGFCDGIETSCNCQVDCGECPGCCAEADCLPGTDDGSCGTNAGVCETCVLGEVCIDGDCQCSPEQEIACFEGNLHWYDSCGNVESEADSCKDNNPCTLDSCNSAGFCTHNESEDGTDCAPDTVCKDGTCIHACDDALEPNNSCQTASVVTDGSFKDLVMAYPNDDYYRVLVAPGELINVVITTTPGYFWQLYLHNESCTGMALDYWESNSSTLGATSWSNNTGEWKWIRVWVGANEMNCDMHYEMFVEVS